MKLSGTYSFAAAREKVFAAITDPVMLQQCIEGCEKMTLTAPDSYDAHLKIGLAGLKGQYVGKVQLRDKLPPIRYTLVIDGKGAPGFVKGTARIELLEKAGQTELRCEAEALVGGVMAAIGSRLIEATARKMMDGFFSRFGQQLPLHAA